MWAYIVRSKLQKIAKWRKEGIKKYILEWDDGKPEPAPKIKKAKQHE